MQVGTKSLLFGVHQFLWHPLTVWIAWVRLYGVPGWRESVCILVHDWGYWGSPEMDGPIGSRHPFFGARVADYLFGRKYHDLVLHHSRHLAEKLGAEPSRLCWADKFSMCSDPRAFYLFRARLTGELTEYRERAAISGFIPVDASDVAWHLKLTRHLAGLARSHLL